MFLRHPTQNTGANIIYVNQYIDTILLSFIYLKRQQSLYIEGLLSSRYDIYCERPGGNLLESEIIMVALIASSSKASAKGSITGVDIYLLNLK